jgi:predicted GIY-YIG superfamily endonuclease
MEVFYVYVLYKIGDTNIRYIGVTNNPNKRLKTHISESFNKKGKEYHLAKSNWIRKHKDIGMRVIFSSSKEECYNKEIYYIKMAKAKNKNILNLTNGGDSPIPINQLSNFEEIREKIKNKSLGRKVSKETKLKMSISSKLSNKQHLKMFHKGIENPRAFKIKQCDLFGNILKIWDYTKLAGSELNINSCSIYACIKNNQKTAGGFKWEKF